jgi:hypothetical protein
MLAYLIPEILMLKSQFILVPLLIAMAAICSFAQNNTPVGAARSFYEFDRAHSQTFNRQNIDARKEWLSPELYSLFRNELRRQDAYLKKNPNDKPYFGDGLPFRPYDETCKAGRRDLHKSLAVKPAFQKGIRAAVTATFAFPKPCKDPDATTYTIGLVRGKTGWLTDDVNFGDERSLETDLRRKEY